MSIRDEMEEAAEALEASGNYRILRRLPAWQQSDPPGGTDGIKVGAIVDVETTGLDPNADAVIEFGLQLFNYDRAGRIYRLSDPYQGFNDPGRPISEEITKITGITDDMVKGQALDTVEIDEMLGVANFVIAHHAAFDRKFVEKIAPIAVTKPWGCSMEQVPWAAHGFRSRGLENIIGARGFFYDAHRSTDDCLAAIAALSLDLDGRPALAWLRDTASKPTQRLWAEGSPFDTKDVLKARGYHWNDGNNGHPKAWAIDLTTDAEIDAERQWLAANIYKRAVTLKVDAINFYDRFSVRG